MKNKLVFRILGALASALIIVSVFVPFISVTGYTTSLWESFELTNSLYLPIMIIVFGAIGVIFFALNIKTEFAYMSTGAITFFLVMQTIDIVNQGVFNTLSLGYYFLAIGALLTGVMAFLTNLKSKKKEEKVDAVVQSVQPSMLDQIDKLYNEQSTVQNEISPIQPVNNVVEPIPVQPLETVTPVQPIDNIVEPVAVQPQPMVQPVQDVPVAQPIQDAASVQQPTVQPQQIVVEPQVVNQQPVNPVLQEFAQPVNPVVQEFTNPTPQVQPTVVEPVQPIQPEISTEQPIINEPAPANPVVQEFTNPSSVGNSQTNPNSGLDIFGQ